MQPEAADTTTFGIVYQPSWLTGFSTSVDWYRIDISDAIGQLTAQNEVTACANGSDPSLCQYVIRRDGAPNGVIERVETLYEGFTVDENKWWHYDYRDWRSSIQNERFEDIAMK